MAAFTEFCAMPFCPKRHGEHNHGVNENYFGQGLIPLDSALGEAYIH
jgi:hypothetical protein